AVSHSWWARRLIVFVCLHDLTFYQLPWCAGLASGSGEAGLASGCRGFLRQSELTQPRHVRPDRSGFFRGLVHGLSAFQRHSLPARLPFCRGIGKVGRKLAPKPHLHWNSSPRATLQEKLLQELVTT